MRIAVDFDGTIVENCFPEIGEERPFAVDVLKKLQKEEHHVLILWTVRTGVYLEQALDWCEKKGLVFDSVNAPYYEDGEQPLDGIFSCKVNAQLFIDDHNLGGIPDWTTIYRMITSGEAFDPVPIQDEICSSRPKNLFIRFGEWLESVKAEVEVRRR